MQGNPGSPVVFDNGKWAIFLENWIWNKKNKKWQLASGTTMNGLPVNQVVWVTPGSVASDSLIPVADAGGWNAPYQVGRVWLAVWPNNPNAQDATWSLRRDYQNW